MRRIKEHFDSVAMLQTRLLFLYPAEVDKKFNSELEFRSAKVPWDFDTVVAICFSITILGLIGNVIVIWLLCCTIKRTKFTIYVANLAVADFIILLRSFFSFVLYFTSIIMTPRMAQVMALLFLFGLNTNSHFLTVLSTERCLTVFSPVWYQSRRPKYPTELICIIVWMLSVILSTIDHFLCSSVYISAFSIGETPCEVETMFQDIIAFMILTPIMVLTTLAIFIRLKIKPRENLPSRLDISILVTVSQHLIFAESTEIMETTLAYLSSAISLDAYFVILIFYCMASSVNPYLYFLVGCWKREKAREPCFMFLERALRDERNGSSMRTQPPQDQA